MRNSIHVIAVVAMVILMLSPSDGLTSEQKKDMATFQTGTRAACAQLTITINAMMQVLVLAADFVSQSYEQTTTQQQTSSTTTTIPSGGGGGAPGAGQATTDFSSRLPVVFGDLTYVSAAQSKYGVPYAVDATSYRTSEFLVFSTAISTAPSVPYPSYTNNGTDCICSAAWTSWCSKVTSTGDTCTTPCSRACDLYWATDATDVLDSIIPVYFKSLDMISIFAVIRGTQERTDWAKIWVRDIDGVAMNMTIAEMLSNVTAPLPGGDAWNGTSEAAGDVTWSAPYVSNFDEVTVTMLTPIWSNTTYLGGLRADMSVTTTAAVLNDLNVTGGGFSFLMGSNGLVAMGSTKAWSVLFPGQTQNQLIHISSSTVGDFSWLLAEYQSGSTSGAGVMTIDGAKYVVAYTQFNDGALFVSCSPRSEVFVTGASTLTWILLCAFLIPTAVLAVVIIAFSSSLCYWRRRVVQLEQDLTLSAVTDALGTPAESVIQDLLAIQKKKLIHDSDRARIFHIISLIASNKLFRADSTLKQRLGALNLDKDVDAFLIDTLVHTDSHHSSSDLREMSGALHMTGEVIAPREVCIAMEELFSVDQMNGKNYSFQSWDFDIVQMSQKHNGSQQLVLEAIAMALFQSHGLIDKFDLDVTKLKAFINRIATGYQDNPYHCALHAADVSQALNYLIFSTQDTFQFTDVELLGILIAVIAHDFHHPGVNNNFLSGTLDKLAVRYNFNSPLENMHSSEALSSLLMEDTNFLSHLPRETFTDVCKVVTSIILATDMAKHLEVTSQFSAKIASGTFDPRQKADRMAGLLIMMKFSDISNSARPWTLCEFWAHRVMNEFFLQGDKEKEHGLSISPMMDRATDIPKCQAAFSEFVVCPLTELVGKILPPEVATKLTSTVKANCATWKSKLQAPLMRPQSTQSAASHHSKPPSRV